MEHGAEGEKPESRFQVSMFRFRLLSFSSLTPDTLRFVDWDLRI